MKHILISILLLMPICLSAQFTVKGVIVDETGETLPGVSVVEVGKPTNGVISGPDGDFVLKVASEKSKITISYLGFISKTLDVSANMEISMEENENMLKEVEIVRQGFGTKSRISNIAAISQINAAQIRQLPSSSIQNALAGRIPGLFQLQGSGQPGEDAANLYIRGQGSFNSDVSHDPLVLIDDIESDISTLSRISANDIEDISILKDAASTAIFGIKGADGVILVTTRRGKLGKPRVTFRMDFGLQRPTYKNKFLNSYDALTLLKELHTNDQNTTDLNNEKYFSDEALEHYRLQDMPYVYPDVDWYNLLYKKNSLQQQYTADVQGGVDKVKYFVSFSYLDQRGLFKNMPKQEDFNNDYYQHRYNLRANFDIQVTKELTAKINANAILTEINEPNMPATSRGMTDVNIFNRIIGAGIAPYSYPAYQADGSFGGYTGTYINPLAQLTYGGYKRQMRNNLNGNITLEYDLNKITQGLKARGVMGLTNTWGWRRDLTRSEVLDYYYEPATNALAPVVTNQYILAPLSVSAVTADYKPVTQMNTRFDLSYDRKFGPHSINALALANWYSNRDGAGAPRNSVNVTGRVGYNFDSRYMVEVSAAYNGSDAFAKGHRYDLFPAISAGWNLAQEPYLKSIAEAAHIEMFKLRGSYGQTGSDKMKQAFAYKDIYDVVMNYHFGESSSTAANKIGAIAMSYFANPLMSWETEKKTNIGIDLQMLNGRLSLTADYFYNKRTGILAEREDIVYYAGYYNIFSGADGTAVKANQVMKILPYMNIGSTENSGWDGELSWRDKIGKVDYFLRGTFSYAKNKILDMGEAATPYTLSMRTGRPIGTIFGYVADGFYTSYEDIANSPYDVRKGEESLAPGDIKFKDISGPNGAPDGLINEYDRVAIGKDVPDLTYGISFGFNYKNFDFSTLFQGATGASVSVEEMLRLASGTVNPAVGDKNGKPMPIHQGRWRNYDDDGNLVTDAAILAEMNKNATYPRLTRENGVNKEMSTFWLRSADYIRWKNIEVGYTLPSVWMNRLGVSSVRFYFTAQNLYTWSNLKDYQIDPESTKTGITTYPQQQVYNFGCQINF
ncbi:TonB-linked SusC/RagA family outer membrane protein [Dysgonomonas hofstadii]|uniref:TonB-linked SusC/RagA family outer membrane protein n=1 Tax=Dysgonomonas hofstadii TaxID=637886 RepID=A0A840CGA8_9BACT|nr:TonB-dependent receptor [Dysgonomonas hofstadii]MBB4034251.1 TonB-linked SusC/RagA family outer membrane protein [Dysgonomonas hofstadii]